jgi:hypothetical protein
MDDTLLCLQYWINIIDEYNVDFYIICDDKNLELKILEQIVFKNSNIKFICSIKKPFKKIVGAHKLSKRWLNAAYAHLTVFYHAKKNNIENYWNIDADDSLFLVKPSVATVILKAAQNYSDENDLSAFSFDFWSTKTRGKHWSFGITYTRANVDYFKLLDCNNIDWSKYKDYTSVHNIDWVFTFLKDLGQAKLMTFYVENLYFIHWGRFLGDAKNAFIAFWKNGEMSYPIRTNIFKDPQGIFPILDDNTIVKFDLDINEEDCLDFGKEYLINLKKLSNIEYCEVV